MTQNTKTEKPLSRVSPVQYGPRRQSSPVLEWSLFCTSPLHLRSWHILGFRLVQTIQTTAIPNPSPSAPEIAYTISCLKSNVLSLKPRLSITVFHYFVGIIFPKMIECCKWGEVASNIYSGSLFCTAWVVWWKTWLSTAVLGAQTLLELFEKMHGN